MSTQWTDGSQDVDPLVGPRDRIACAAAAAGVTLVAALVLQVLVVAVALGTADYDRGEPGPGGGLGFGLLTALAVGGACVAGGWVGARCLRWRYGSMSQARVVGIAGSAAPVLLLVLLDVAVGSPHALAVVLIVVAAVAGALLGARWGAAAPTGRR